MGVNGVPLVRRVLLGSRSRSRLSILLVIGDYPGVDVHVNREFISNPNGAVPSANQEQILADLFLDFFFASYRYLYWMLRWMLKIICV